jgi:hypothetical protein
MADDRQSQDLMGYEGMAQEALRGVVKAALKRAAQPGGLPGAHHLYITFRTRAPGVSAPPELTDRYADEMTVVLQHQFWDLAPGETFFAVTLKFGGSPKRLSVPYAAVTRFYDPSVQFLLQFEPGAAADEPEGEVVPMRPRAAPALVAEAPEPPAAEAPAEPEAAAPGPDPGPPGDGPKIVSLDKFRKK